MLDGDESGSASTVRRIRHGLVVVVAPPEWMPGKVCDERYDVVVRRCGEEWSEC